MTASMNAAGVAIVRGPSGRGPRTKAAKQRAQQRHDRHQQPSDTKPQRDQR